MCWCRHSQANHDENGCLPCGLPTQPLLDPNHRFRPIATLPAINPLRGREDFYGWRPIDRSLDAPR